MGLAFAGLACTLAINVGGIQQLAYVHLLILLVFFVLSIAIAGRDVLFGGPVTTNWLVGVVCIYLLLGMIWAILYVFLNTISPGAFSGVESGAPAAQLPNLIYYSFVTMTTLGYGDITPLKPTAGTLAYLEAVFGQFYVAVVVAELVAMHIGQREVAESKH